MPKRKAPGKAKDTIRDAEVMIFLFKYFIIISRVQL